MKVNITFISYYNCYIKKCIFVGNKIMDEPIYIYISSSSKKITQMLDWCEINTTSYWYDSEIYYRTGIRCHDNVQPRSFLLPGISLFVRFGFEDEETASWFKLIWAGE